MFLNAYFYMGSGKQIIEGFILSGITADALSRHTQDSIICTSTTKCSTSIRNKIVLVVLIMIISDPYIIIFSIMMSLE